MSVLPNVSDHTAAVADYLADLNIGRGVKPADTGWQGTKGQSPFVAYGIVWRIGSNDRRNWSLEGDTSEGRLMLFVRTFGGTVAEAEGLLDAVSARMLAKNPDGTWSLEVPDRRVVNVLQDNGSTTTVSEDTEVGLFEAGDFFRVFTDPETP